MLMVDRDTEKSWGTDRYWVWTVDHGVQCHWVHWGHGLGKEAILPKRPVRCTYGGTHRAVRQQGGSAIFQPQQWSAPETPPPPPSLTATTPDPPQDCGYMRPGILCICPTGDGDGE